MTSHSSVIVLFVPILLAWLVASTALAQDSNSKLSSLVARLKLDEEGGSGSPNCWDSLFQLRSCTGEVLLFFLNGETYLGPGCCSAIRVIQHHCWPSMLWSLGFTAEEGDILRGYCDAAATPPPVKS